MLERSLCRVLQSMPDAIAYVYGSDKYPDISGQVRFHQMNNGVLVAAEVAGLPATNSSNNTSGNMSANNTNCQSPIFGFHIHEGGSCTGNAENPFADALTHYNPYNCMHPYHAGDMPPLFGNNGYALSVFFTDRFMVNEVIGRTVIIHANPDDFHTQPSGNSGEMIACGMIEKY